MLSYRPKHLYSQIYCTTNLTVYDAKHIEIQEPSQVYLCPMKGKWSQQRGVAVVRKYCYFNVTTTEQMKTPNYWKRMTFNPFSIMAIITNIQYQSGN